jgi:UDP-GlcNAc:undecaprenyl-phosphate GlcNAc-1-phosphate transferase
MHDLTPYWPALAAFACALVFTRPAEWLGRKLGLVDRPDGALKIHSTPTPRSGGVALFVAFALAAVVAAALDRPLVNGREAVVGTLIFALGLWDDRRPRSPRLRLVLQLLIYVAAFAAGLRLLPGWPAWGAFAAGLVWFVIVINAANFYDGMDGVLPLSALLAFAVWGFGATAIAPGGSVALVAAFALAGFLPRNWYPSRIFLGDGGSFLVGYVFYLAMARAAQAELGPVPGLLIAAVPVCDAGAATLDRLFRGRDPLTGDRDHIYDLLARRGLAPAAVALLLGALSGLCALLAVFVAPLGAAVRWTTVVTLYVTLTLTVLAARYRYRSTGLDGQSI